jgi:hypothetical protein
VAFGVHFEFFGRRNSKLFLVYLFKSRVRPSFIITVDEIDNDSQPDEDDGIVFCLRDIWYFPQCGHQTTLSYHLVQNEDLDECNATCQYISNYIGNYTKDSQTCSYYFFRPQAGFGEFLDISTQNIAPGDLQHPVTLAAAWQRQPHADMAMRASAANSYKS